MLNRLSSETLLRWQQYCLFAAVLLFPLQGPPAFLKVLGPVSFFGQPSSVPVVIGLILCAVTCCRTAEDRRCFCCALALGGVYLVFLAGLSLHAIAVFAPYDETVFKMTPKMATAAAVLSSLGLQDEILLWKVLIFLRDMRIGAFEAVYAFGFAAWVSYLYVKNRGQTFRWVRLAVVVDFCLLVPYVTLEVLHLYGVGGVTQVLKLVNPCLYEPAHFLGWYPPVVSPNQVRGTWTEPAYFAIWLAFAVPFLVHRLLEKADITAGGWLWRGLCLSALFTVWWMTYARTSVVLMVPLVLLYITVALWVRTPQSRRAAGSLTAVMVVGFLLVSQWGPQDIGRTESTFVETTVKSSVEVESRSNPSRLQDFMSKVGVFKEHPLWGVGDTLAPWYQMEWLQTASETLTDETQDRIRKTQASGVFDSGLNGNSLFVPAILAGRGLAGFAAFMLPILVTGLGLLGMLRRSKKERRAVGITVLIASVETFLSAFSQGLWFFYFWCALGLAWGFIVCGRREC